MDSNEIRPLTETAILEAAEVTVAIEATATPIQSKEDVIARLQEISQQEEPANKAELDALKQSFYRLRNIEIENARKTHEENGTSLETFVTPKDEHEILFKELMGSIKEKLNTLKPTCFIPQKARRPAKDAPKAASSATFSLGAHSAYTSSYLAMDSVISVLGVPG